MDPFCQQDPCQQISNNKIYHIAPPPPPEQRNKSEYNSRSIYSGDPEIGPPMGLTESGPILESVRFVKPAN